MVYRKEHAIEAWKTFVSTGAILEDKVRPEIARSWLRCRAAGVNPWSSDFTEQNLALLEEKRQRFAASLKSTVPVMKFLKEMLGCNVSLMDGENFVFELLSPLAVYPRTFGTFTREEEVGTGNATLVAYEKKPVRVDGFEHYRAIVQTYSGVSVPYLDGAGKYYGAMNINSPFAVLPQSALQLCRIGVSLTNDLHRAGAKAGALLSTPTAASWAATRACARIARAGSSIRTAHNRSAPIWGRTSPCRTCSICRRSWKRRCPCDSRRDARARCTSSTS